MSHMMPNRDVSAAGAFSHTSCNGVGSGKKRQAPLPPRKRNSDEWTKLLHGLVNEVRSHSQLSHSLAQSTACLVLQYVAERSYSLEECIPCIINFLGDTLEINKECITSCADTRELENTIRTLTLYNISESRNWVVSNECNEIPGSLERLLNLLTNADKRCSLYVLASDDYTPLLSIVEFLLVEECLSHRKILIKIFRQICSLDPLTIIPILLSKPLADDLSRAFMSESLEIDGDLISLLTVLFRLGTPSGMPQQFVSNVLNTLCLSNDQDIKRQIVFLLLSYNVQFNEINGFNFVDALASCRDSRLIGETVLFYFNTGYDPCSLRKFLGWCNPDEQSLIPNAIHKFIGDVFRHAKYGDFFSEGDNCILINVIVRQLLDLGGNQHDIRMQYLQLCHDVLTNYDYNNSMHDAEDLISSFRIILNGRNYDNAEDGQKIQSEIDIVVRICQRVSRLADVISDA